MCVTRTGTKKRKNSIETEPERKKIYECDLADVRFNSIRVCVPVPVFGYLFVYTCVCVCESVGFLFQTLGSFLSLSLDIVVRVCIKLFLPFLPCTHR